MNDEKIRAHEYYLRHRESIKARAAQYYADHKEQVSERRRRNYANHKAADRTHTAARIRAWSRYWDGCERCGSRFPPCVLDSHHLDPAHKQFHLARPQQPSEAVWLEFLGCQTLCANCHRLVHHEMRRAG